VGRRSHSSDGLQLPHLPPAPQLLRSDLLVIALAILAVLAAVAAVNLLGMAA
jgi:hypothetical protein